MNFLNLFLVGATASLLALGTNATAVNGQNRKSQLPVNTDAIDLGIAANYTVLSEWGILNTGDTKITGDIGVSPGEATAVKGFDLKIAYGESFSSSPLVIGKVYAANYRGSTPYTLTSALIDMLNAYTDAWGRAVDVADLSYGNIGGIKLPPGVYKWNSDVTIESDITLEGGPQDIWIFQIAQNLNTNPGTKVILSDGAQTKNIFWVVEGETVLGTDSIFNGTIFSQADITMRRGAILNGRALTQTRVSLDSNTIKITE